MNLSAIIEWINEGWIDDSFFVHFHHNEDERHFTDIFPDSVHHMGFYITALILLDALDDETADAFLIGVEMRDFPSGFIRHPRMKKNELCNRDQFTPFIFALNHVDPDLAKDLYERMEEVIEPLQVHHHVHFERSLGERPNYIKRLIGDFVELFDTVSDVLNQAMIPMVHWKPFGWLGWDFKPFGWLSGRNGVDSSIIKNGCRAVIGLKYHPTFLSKLNWWFLNKSFDLDEVFTRYFTHSFDKDRDNPPPIHLVWLEVFKRVREERESRDQKVAA